MTRPLSRFVWLSSVALLFTAALINTAQADWDTWNQRRRWGWGDGYHSAYRWCGGCTTCGHCATSGKQKTSSSSLTFIDPSMVAAPPWQPASDWLQAWPNPAVTVPQTPTVSIPFVGNPPRTTPPAPTPAIRPPRLNPAPRPLRRMRRPLPPRQPPRPEPRTPEPPSPSDLRDTTSSTELRPPWRNTSQSGSTPTRSLRTWAGSVGQAPTWPQ